jgi:hypothetical protein
LPYREGELARQIHGGREVDAVSHLGGHHS